MERIFPSVSDETEPVEECISLEEKKVLKFHIEFQVANVTFRKIFR